MIDHYQTIARQARARLKEQRSIFIGIFSPVCSENEFNVFRESVVTEFPDATHHCWAWRLFEVTAVQSRSSDDGEPSGSAGRPILAAIEDAALSNVAAIVVRYYGGTKLGTGGLARAYRDSARAAAAEAERLDKYVYRRLVVEPSFAAAGSLYRMISPPDVKLIGEVYGETTEVTVDVRLSIADVFEKGLKERQLRFRRV